MNGRFIRQDGAELKQIVTQSSYINANFPISHHEIICRGFMEQHARHVANLTNKDDLTVTQLKEFHRALLKNARSIPVPAEKGSEKEDHQQFANGITFQEAAQVAVGYRLATVGTLSAQPHQVWTTSLEELPTTKNELAQLKGSFLDYLKKEIDSYKVDSTLRCERPTMTLEQASEVYDKTFHALFDKQQER